jgi:hypothetical protein
MPLPMTPAITAFERSPDRGRDWHVTLTRKDILVDGV